MSLVASLEDIELEELMRLLATSEQTGTLALRAGPRLDTMRFACGEIRIDDRAADDLIDALFDLIESGIREATFTRSAVEDEDAETVPVGDVLRKVASRDEEWRAIREAIPSMSARLGLRSDAPAASARASLDAGEWPVICLLGSPRSAGHVEQELGLGALATCRILLGLISKGLVEVLPEVDAGGGTQEEAYDGDVPADLLVRGVKDVLADVEAEMRGIQARQRRLRQNVAAQREEEVPAEWLSYFHRLDKDPPPDEQEGAQ